MPKHVICAPSSPLKNSFTYRIYFRVIIMFFVFFKSAVHLPPLLYTIKLCDLVPFIFDMAATLGFQQLIHISLTVKKPVHAPDLYHYLKCSPKDRFRNTGMV